MILKAISDSICLDFVLVFFGAGNILVFWTSMKYSFGLHNAISLTSKLAYYRMMKIWNPISLMK